MAYNPHNIQIQNVYKDKYFGRQYGEERYITVLQVVGDNIQVIESDVTGHPASYSLPKTLPAKQILDGFQLVAEMSRFNEETLA